MATGKKLSALRPVVPAHGYYRLSPTIQIHLPHGRTVFIKQAPFSTHRTLHETFGARRPSSVFFGNRFRSADCQKIQLPPGGSQGSRYVFARDFIKTRVPTATPQPLRRQLPFQGRLGVCRHEPQRRAQGLPLSGALGGLPLHLLNLSGALLMCRAVNVNE